MTSKKNYEEGIYFDMPEDEYHKIPYFSRSGADKILFDEEQYWHDSPMNPDYKPQESNKSMDLGSAIHCMLLEPKRFKDLYAKYPTKADYEDRQILKTNDDLKEFLESVGEKKTGKKEDLISRAVEYVDPKESVIWDLIVQEFLEDVEQNGKRILSDEHTEIIEGVYEAFKRRKRIPEILQNVKSEVVIIWKDERTGIMCKCMIDSVRPEAIGEVKTFSVKNYNCSLQETMFKEIRYRRYNHQFYVYSQALQTAINKVNSGKAKVYGDVDSEWLTKFLEVPNKRFFMMFFRTQAPYQCKSYELEYTEVEGATANSYFILGESMWNTALDKLQACYAKYGINRFQDDDEVVTLTDELIPSIIYQSSDF